MIQERNLATCIILTIVTCGIYGIYWFYSMLKELYILNGEPDNAGTDILLTIVTCGIYSYYLLYQAGKRIDSIHRRFGLAPKDDSVIYLILSIFGLSIVAYVLIQGDLNDFMIPAYRTGNVYPNNTVFVNDDDTPSTPPEM